MAVVRYVAIGCVSFQFHVRVSPPALTGGLPSAPSGPVSSPLAIDTWVAGTVTW